MLHSTGLSKSMLQGLPSQLFPLSACRERLAGQASPPLASAAAAAKAAAVAGRWRFTAPGKLKLKPEEAGGLHGLARQ